MASMSFNYRKKLDKIASQKARAQAAEAAENELCRAQQINDDIKEDARLRVHKPTVHPQYADMVSFTSTLRI